MKKSFISMIILAVAFFFSSASWADFDSEVTASMASQPVYVSTMDRPDNDGLIPVFAEKPTFGNSKFAHDAKSPSISGMEGGFRGCMYARTGDNGLESNTGGLAILGENTLKFRSRWPTPYPG